MSRLLTYLDAGGRRLLDCHACGQAAKLELFGERLIVSCFAGCEQDAALAGYDLDKLRAEIRKAAANARDDGEPELLPPPSVPMDVARTFAAKRYTHPAGLTLRHWRGGWWRWHGSHWSELEPSAVRAEAYRFTEHALYPTHDALEPWAPTRHKVANLLDALAAVVHLPESVMQPGWIEGAHDGLIVSLANGLLDVGRRELFAHSPDFFNVTSVPFAYDPDAGPPCRWFRFLDELWGDDDESLNALQEWFGYVISGRLDLHKMLLLVGPTRAGKGAIARVQGALVGHENVAGPTLTSLGGDFGLAPLLGKPLAVISDARLDGRKSNTVVERLLAISGEDAIIVNRKYREQWTGKLPCRFMVISNELPHLGDASAAIAGRFVTLLLTRSWLGHEDPTLEPELPGILNWALGGLDRLERTGRFTTPRSTDEAFVALQDLASPVGAFVRDRCTVELAAEMPIDELWSAWKGWAEENGHRAGTKQRFGRDLRAVVPHVKVVQPRDGEDRHRVYRGISLRSIWGAQ